MNDKKARERYIVTEFAQVYVEFPTGPISDSEEPDFLVGNIGVEVTRFMHGQGLQGGSKVREGEELRKRVITRAQDQFEAICTTPYYVSLVWGVRNQIQFNDVELLATELAKLIMDCTKQGTAKNAKVEWHQLVNTPLFQVISWVSVTAIGKKGFWAGAEAGWVEISYDPLKQRVAEKESKLPAYRQKCEQVWLLIAADGDGMSSVAEISPLIPSETIATNFDRVFFFSLINKNVITLAKNR